MDDANRSEAGRVIYYEMSKDGKCNYGAIHCALNLAVGQLRDSQAGGPCMLTWKCKYIVRAKGKIAPSLTCAQSKRFNKA